MFCDPNIIENERKIQNDTCVFLSGQGYNPEGVLQGAGLIIPLAHKETVFDLSEK